MDELHQGEMSSQEVTLIELSPNLKEDKEGCLHRANKAPVGVANRDDSDPEKVSEVAKITEACPLLSETVESEVFLVKRDWGLNVKENEENMG